MALKINGTTVINDSRTLENIVNGTLSGNLTITSNTASTSTTSGALTIAGGMAVAGNLYVGKIYGDGSALTGVAAGTATTAATADVVSNAAQPNITSLGTLTALTVSGNSNLAILNANSQVTFSGNINSTSTGTGTVIISGTQGGLGVAGNVYANAYYGDGSNLTGVGFSGGTVANATTFTANVSSTSGSTGSVIIGGANGGLGVQGNVRVGNNLHINGNGENDTRFWIGAPTVEGANIFTLKTSSIDSNWEMKVTAHNTATGQVARLGVVRGGLGSTGAIDFKPTTAANASTSVPSGYLSFLASGSADVFWIGNPSGQLQVSARGALASTSSNTGSLIITSNGGLGVEGNINVDGTVNKFGGGTDSTSTTSGVVQVTGGVGVSGNIYAARFFGNGAGLTGITASTATSATTAATVTTNAQPNITSTGTLTALTVSGTSNLAVLNANGQVTFSGNIASTSTGTGTVVISGTQGGLGVAGVIRAGSIQGTPIGNATASSGAFTTLTASGATTFTAATASTSTGTGTVVVTGGLGVSGNVFAAAFSGNGAALTGITATNWSGGTVSSAVSITDATASTSAVTGALVVTGGVGVSGNVRTAGRVFITDTSVSTSQTSGALIVSGGTVVSGNLNVYGSSSVFVTQTPSTNSGTGTLILFGSAGLGVGGNINVGGPNSTFTGGTASTDTASGTIVVTGGIGVSGNVRAAAFFGSGAGLTGITSATTAATVTTAAQPNITSTGTLTSLTVTGNVSAGNVSGTLLTGNVSSSGTSGFSTATFSTLANVTATTASTSSTTGALIVAGGAGIGGNAFVGGNVTITGNLTVNGTTTTINSTVVTVDDIVLELGDVTTPTDTTANGGGILLKGATNKTITWVQSTGRWTSNQPFEATTFSGSGALLTAIPAANISGTVASATSAGTATSATSATSATTAGTVTTANQSNITSLGTLTSLTADGAVTLNNSLTVGGLYTSPTQTLTLSVATETWVRLATVINRCAVKIYLGVGSSTSEEESEIEIFGTYNVSNTLIDVKRQTYAEHLREVRVTQSAGGSVKEIFVRVRSDGSAATLNWRMHSSRGFSTINNDVVSPTNSAESVLVSPNNTYSSNSIFTLRNNTASTSTTTGALQISGGAGIVGNLFVGGTISGNVSSSGTSSFSTATFSTLANITATTASTSTATGALIVAGGVGVGGNLFLGGNTASTSTTTGTVVITGGMGVSGNVFVGGTNTATYADLAEKYVADAAYEPGTVLAFGGDYEVTLAAEETIRVAGVVSTNPAYLMNQGAAGDHVVAVAFTGRVPTKVRGTVRKGDMMVSAGGGYARATIEPKFGAVIGKALQDFDGEEGVIEVVVGRY